MPETAEHYPETEDGETIQVWTNGREWFVATDFEALRELHDEFVDPLIELDRENWRVMDPEEGIRIRYDAEKRGIPEGADSREIPEEAREFPEWTHRVEATAAQWAGHVGNGVFLSTTEY